MPRIFLVATNHRTEIELDEAMQVPAAKDIKSVIEASLTNLAAAHAQQKLKLSYIAYSKLTSISSMME